MKHEDSGKSLGELFEEIESGLATWESLTTTVIQNPGMFETKQNEIDAVFDATRGYIDQIEMVMENYQQQAIQEEKDQASYIAMTMFISLVVEWIVLIALGIWIIRQISRTIQRVRGKTQRVSAGYLDLPDAIRYPGDELGQIQKDVDDMVVRMRDLIKEILDNSRAVSSATGELAASASESATASSHIAENIQEVTHLVEIQSNITSESSRAVEEMTIGVQRIAESVKSASLPQTRSSRPTP